MGDKEAYLSLLCILSTAAFNVVSSTATNALLSTYVISISYLLARRLRGPSLPPRYWSLGNFGLPTNAFAVLFLV